MAKKTLKQKAAEELYYIAVRNAGSATEVETYLTEPNQLI